jgi:hypothetical protein
LDYLVRHFLWFARVINRDSIWGDLRIEGLSRAGRLPLLSQLAARASSRTIDLGFRHIDIKHLLKLKTANGETRKRYRFVAIDRRSRSVRIPIQGGHVLNEPASAGVREGVA